MALILVADDDAAIRQVVRRILEPGGHQIVEAGNGRLALQLLRQNQQVELVITDILMPEQEGIETILEIRRNYPAVRILAISGGRSGKAAAAIYLGAASKLGADATLNKPFRATELSQVVDELLAKPAIGDRTKDTEPSSPQAGGSADA